MCGKLSSPGREELEKKQPPVHPYRLVEQELSGITELIKKVLKHNVKVLNFRMPKMFIVISLKLKQRGQTL